MMKGIRKITIGKIIIYFIVSIFAFVCIYPFLMVISGSLTTSEDIVKHGISFIPRHISIAAYKALFMNKAYIINSYKLTIFVTVAGTFTSLFVNSQLVLFDIVMGNKAGSPKKQCSNPV